MMIFLKDKNQTFVPSTCTLYCSMKQAFTSDSEITNKKNTAKHT